VIADDVNWIKELMTETETRDYYQLALTNFIESVIRIAYLLSRSKGLKAEPLSVIFDTYVKITMINCCVIEGFALAEEAEDIEVQEIMDYYEDKLFELYEKLKIIAWSPLDYSNYFTFDKISYSGNSNHII